MDVVGRGSCGQVIQQNPILKHASEVYTRALYLNFKKEYLDSLSVAILNDPTYYNIDDLDFVALIKENFGIKKRCVKYTKSGGFGKCTCCKWEVEGLLCKHLLRVMSILNIGRIPEHYVLKRWSKSTKYRNVNQKASDRNVGPGGDFVKILVRDVRHGIYI